MQLKPEFLCECVDWKVDFLKQAFPDVKVIFTNMLDLHRGKAHDAISEKIVDVPGAACLPRGFGECQMSTHMHGRVYTCTHMDIFML